MSVNLSPWEDRSCLDDTDAGPRANRNPLIVLVVPSGSYRTGDFVNAAKALRVDIVVASDGDLPSGDIGSSRSLVIDCVRPEWSARRIARIKPPPDAVIAADDGGVVIAALASSLLGLSSNSFDTVTATTDKAHMRGILAAAGVSQPIYSLAEPGRVAVAADRIGFPCVVKPRRLSASRGVMRVDDVNAAELAEDRIRAIVHAASGKGDETLLVESFIDGAEVAVECLLVDGELHVLALLDKPEPLDGPFFEETTFVTPSRHPEHLQEEIVAVVRSAASALGLVSGPVHAEVRCGADGVVLIEVAARSIGGLCGRSLSFGLLGESLESLILRSALQMPGSGLGPATAATGVRMLPIPHAGTLVSIDGVEGALSVPGVTGFNQTIANGRRVVPLPEGDRYLGFLFAQGLTPEAVELSLGTAAEQLDIRIDSSAADSDGAR